MAGEQAILKRSVLAAGGYIAIMAVGMFTAGHVFGLNYSDPALVRVLIFFEVALSLYALIAARRLFGSWTCGFSPINRRGLWWLLPNFLLVAALFTMVFQSGRAELSSLALIIIATMILVGFSEELMFRGVVFRGALRSVGTGKAIFISAVLFAALHSVNVLALLPVESMVEQLVLTFIFGLALACYALVVNSLLPLMLFHTLWDLVQFLGSIYRVDFGPLVFVGIAVNALVAATLWLVVLRKRPPAG